MRHLSLPNELSRTYSSNGSVPIAAHSKESRQWPCLLRHTLTAGLIDAHRKLSIPKFQFFSGMSTPNGASRQSSFEMEAISSDWVIDCDRRSATSLRIWKQCFFFSFSGETVRHTGKIMIGFSVDLIEIYNNEHAANQRIAFKKNAPVFFGPCWLEGRVEQMLEGNPPSIFNRFPRNGNFPQEGKERRDL